MALEALYCSVQKGRHSNGRISSNNAIVEEEEEEEDHASGSRTAVVEWDVKLCKDAGGLVPGEGLVGHPAMPVVAEESGEAVVLHRRRSSPV